MRSLLQTNLIKRVTTRLLIISLTFMLGVTATTLFYLKFNTPEVQTSEITPNPVQPEKTAEPAALPILDFCELAINPEKYDGQTVCLSARMNFGLEGSWFSDSKCPSNGNAETNLAENTTFALSENKEVWKVIGKARVKKDSEFLALKLDMTIVGKFNNEVYKNYGLITPFQIEILQVEKALIPDEAIKIKVVMIY